MNIAIAIGFMAAGLLVIWLWAIAPRLQKHPDLSELQKYDYAHRGLFSNEKGAPENSLEAVRRAANAGFGIEIDLQLTADNRVVVHHDAGLRRSCGADVYLRELSLVQLRDYRLFGTEEMIPTFEDVLSAVGKRVPLIIELKAYQSPAEICPAVWAILKDYDGLYCVESFDPLIVKWFRDNAPQVMRGQLMQNMRRGDNGLTAPAAFCARNMFTNLLTRPHFEAYDFNARGNLSLKAAKRIFGMQEVSWTIRSWSDYQKAKKDGCIVIFEGFDPIAEKEKAEGAVMKAAEAAATVTSCTRE